MHAVTGVCNPISSNLGEMLALIHGEISGALEGHWKGMTDDHPKHRRMCEVELADAMTRIADLAGYLDMDLGGAVMEKLAFNRRRVLENRKG